MSEQNVIVILIGVLILYRIFLRVRRAFSWQEFRPRNIRFKIILMSVLGVLFLAEGASHPVSLISDTLGVGLGVILAFFGSAATRFEHRNGHVMYRSNEWVAGTVTLLFLVRLSFRIYEMLHSGTVQPSAQMGSSWTAGLMLILFAYYVAYNTILLRSQNQLLSPS